MSIYKIPELKPWMRICFFDDALKTCIGIVLPQINRHGIFDGWVVLAWTYETAISPDLFNPNADFTTSGRKILAHTDRVLWVAEPPIDATRIFNPACVGDMLYNRPRSKRMTMDQLCEALGYPVEIIPSPEGDS